MTDTDTDWVDARTSALLAAAGYPTPPTVTELTQMLLGEIEASKQAASDVYRAGYNLGRQHGYHAGRLAAACERCARSNGGTP